MDYLHRKKSNKSRNWNIFNKCANSVIKLLNVTHLMYIGQTHPTWTILRSPTFNFSRDLWHFQFQKEQYSTLFLQNISATLGNGMY